MKVNRSKLAAGFTLVEIMIVVLIIGILLAIAIPNFVAARETSRAKACVGNLKQIDSATQQFAMANSLSGSSSLSTYTIATLVGPTGYIRATPICPEGGTYSLPATPSGEPYCSISSSALAGDNAGSMATTDKLDYGCTTAGTATTPPTGCGKWFHGLTD
jgi:prepilin-type N-terminal cleavage/methylation domain-containing protein